MSAFYKNILENTVKHEDRLKTIFLGPEIIGVDSLNESEIIPPENKELIKLLTGAYADEWLAVYQYSIESDTVLKLFTRNTINKRVYRQITKELDIHSREEFEHAKKLIPFMIELGSGPISHLDQLSSNANGEFLVPKDNHRIILKQAIESEKGAIKVYTNLLSFIDSMDKKIRGTDKIKLSSTIKFILEQEEEHETDLQKILTDIGPE